MSIKNLKTIYYRVEEAPNESYDKTKAFQEIKVSEYTLEGRTEIFETEILSHSRKLSTSKAGGRNTGSLKITKNLDLSILESHSDLLEAGIGTITSAGTNKTVSAVTTTTITSSSTNYVAGDIIQITADSIKFNNLLVLSADATTVTLRTALSALEVSQINIATVKTVRKQSTCKIGSPVQGSTFCFVVRYDDDSVEVLRGCGVAGSFELSNSGHAKISFDIKSASVDWKDEFNNVYGIPTGTITSESAGGRPVKYDFKSSLLYDTVNSVDKILFPQKLSLKVAHTLENNELIGGLNNINGFYTNPSVECEANFHYNGVNRLTFSDRYEDNTNQFYFCGQSTFAFYAPLCFFVASNPSEYNVYDSINVKMNINTSATSEPIVVLPQ
jgi:hypothetical protein